MIPAFCSTGQGSSMAAMAAPRRPKPSAVTATFLEELRHYLEEVPLEQRLG